MFFIFVDFIFTFGESEKVDKTLKICRPINFQNRLYAMSSVRGNFDIDKEWALVKVVINRKKKV